MLSIRNCRAIAFFFHLRPSAPRVGNGGEQFFVFAALIEQLALRGPAHERLIFHLAVHIDQRFAELTQRLHWHRLAVHVSARATISSDDAPEHAFAFVLD